MLLLPFLLLLQHLLSFVIVLEVGLLPPLLTISQLLLLRKDKALFLELHHLIFQHEKLPFTVQIILDCVFQLLYHNVCMLRDVHDPLPQELNCQLGVGNFLIVLHLRGSTFLQAVAEFG